MDLSSFFRTVSKGYESQIRRILLKFMAPSMTSTERDALLNPENSQIIYNETTNKLQVRAGGAWVDLH